MSRISQQANRVQWETHVNAWSKSGLTQSAYCRKHGLQAQTFSAWVGRVRRMSVALPTPLTMVPVVVNDIVGGAVSNSSRITLHHHSGWQVHLPADVQAIWLGTMLSQLK